MSLHIKNTVELPCFAEKNGVAWDVSTATTKQLFMLAPDGSVLLEKTMIFVTDGTDGYLTYTTTITDITVPGNWMAEVYIVCGGKTLDCDSVTFHFEDNIRGALT